MDPQIRTIVLSQRFSKRDETKDEREQAKKKFYQNLKSKKR
jgi:hypothetical protein